MPRVELPGFRCARCDWMWYSRAEEPPKVCPHCKSPYWDKPIERITTSVVAKRKRFGE